GTVYSVPPKVIRAPGIMDYSDTYGVMVRPALSAKQLKSISVMPQSAILVGSDSLEAMQLHSLNASCWPLYWRDTIMEKTGCTPCSGLPVVIVTPVDAL